MIKERFTYGFRYRRGARAIVQTTLLILGFLRISSIAILYIVCNHVLPGSATFDFPDPDPPVFFHGSVFESYLLRNWTRKHTYYVSLLYLLKFLPFKSEICTKPKSSAVSRTTLLSKRICRVQPLLAVSGYLRQGRQFVYNKCEGKEPQNCVINTAHPPKRGGGRDEKFTDLPLFFLPLSPSFPLTLHPLPPPPLSTPPPPVLGVHSPLAD